MITDQIIARANAQRKSLGRPLLNLAGAERARQDFPFEHVDDVVVAALTDWVIPSASIKEYSSAFEVPRGQRGLIIE